MKANGKDNGLALLDRAIKRAGGKRMNLAIQLGCTELAMIQWQQRKQVPLAWRLLLEKHEKEMEERQ